MLLFDGGVKHGDYNRNVRDAPPLFSIRRKATARKKNIKLILTCSKITRPAYLKISPAEKIFPVSLGTGTRESLFADTNQGAGNINTKENIVRALC